VLALVAVLAALVCAALGHWQQQRLTEKRAWIDEMTRRMELEPLPASVALQSSQDFSFRRVVAEGSYAYAETVLIQNRRRGRQTGVEVITPLRMGTEDRWLLVNRGFVPNQELQAFLAADPPPGPVRLEGVLRPLPRRELPNVVPKRRLRWLRIDLAGLEAQIQRPLWPVALQRADDASGTLPRGGIEPPRSRVDHLHYAITWYSIAAVAAVFALVTFLRRDGGN
jgi:surfeit locus 1 family protein